MTRKTVEPSGAGPDRGLALAEHYLEIDRPDRALELLERADGDWLQESGYWRVRARALVRLDRHADAIRAVEQGLAIDGNDPNLLALLAACRAETGDLAGAERALLTALRGRPEDPWLLSQYALLAARGRQFDKAAKLLDEAHRLAPEDETVMRRRLVLAYLRGDHSEAARQGKALLEQDPEAEYGHYVLGHIASERGRYREADRRFAAAVSIDPAESSYVESLRDIRFRSHPLLWPIRPLARFGPAKVWMAAIGVVYGLNLAGFSRASFTVAMVYLGLCVYSWVVPPLLRRWLARASR